MFVDQNQSKSTLISIIFHIIVVLLLLGFGSAKVLVPSRSDGIEVMLINSTDIAPKELNITPDSNAVQVRTLDSSADINLKQDQKVQASSVKVVQPKTEQNVQQAKLTPAKVQAKKPTNAQLDDLLGQIASAKIRGKSNGAAEGGSTNGTSDTKNMINNYADLVIERVRPYVIIPDGLDNSNKAVVEVTLLPNMQAYAINLIKSSGNNDYDANVQQAIHRVQVFPPLPSGAKFTDYRKLYLTFHPQ